MDALKIDTYNLAETILEICQTIQTEAKDSATDDHRLSNPTQICHGLEHFCDIILELDQSPDSQLEPPDPTSDFSELADFGISLIAQLMDWAELLQLKEISNTLDDVIITTGVWCARNLGNIQQIDPLVNALTRVSNAHTEPDFLIELSQIYQEIANAIAPEIKQDMDNKDPMRPWRILNLNYGIVATRSYNLTVMEQAFEQLLVRLPNDANKFFTEGMEQMEIIDYPTHVRDMMEKYYLRTNNPTLH